MKVAGYNKFSQLNELSNNSSIYTVSDAISPPVNSHLNVSSLLAFSTFYEHSVWINKEGKAFAVGNNSDGRISSTLPNKTLDKETEIIIKNKNGQQCKFLSVVCGAKSTLYLASGQNSNENSQLIYESFNNETIFLNIGNRNPVSLFGGCYLSAVVDSEGAIFVISPKFSSLKSRIMPLFLPNGDKAVNVAFCSNDIIALGSSGQVYHYLIPTSEKSLFVKIDELSMQNIIWISGTNEHCFAVSKDGRVFGFGKFSFNRLGLTGYDKTTKFIEIYTLRTKISLVFAGYDHSIFITSEGKVLTCGYNDYGQTKLFEGPNRDKVLNPYEASYNGKPTFFVAGYGITVAFINCEVPPNTPNKNVKELFSGTSEVDELKKEIERLKKENEILRQNERKSQQRIKELEKKIQYPSKVEKKIRPLEIIDVETLQSYKKIKKVGHGATSEVFVVSRPQKIALKILDLELCKIDDNNDDDDDNFSIDINKMKHFLREYEILNQIDHPNIIKTYGFCFGDKTQEPVILLEYCPSSLKKKIKKLNKNEKIQIIIGIISAMKEVHSLGIIHRDLKLENILLDDNNNVKVSDFGLSTLADASMTYTQMAGTLKFMAPELVNCRTDINEKVDVYSFGVLVYLIISEGEFPKIGLADVGNGKKAEIPENFSSFSRNLINKCWSFEAKDRPSFEEIYNIVKGNEMKLI